MKSTTNAPNQSPLGTPPAPRKKSGLFGKDGFFKKKTALSTTISAVFSTSAFALITLIFLAMTASAALAIQTPVATDSSYRGYGSSFGYNSYALGGYGIPFSGSSYGGFAYGAYPYSGGYGGLSGYGYAYNGFGYSGGFGYGYNRRGYDAYNPTNIAIAAEYDERYDPWRGYSAGPPPPTFGGCFISTGHGLLDDYDCDKIPDTIDNCPTAANPAQHDQTRNGLGDMCDLVIEEITINPGVVLQGRALSADIVITNYRDYVMKSAKLTLEVPLLGVTEYQQVQNLIPEQTVEEQILSRIPVCALPGEYELFITLEYFYAAGHKEVFEEHTTIAVEQSDACPLDNPLDNSIIDILELQDIDPEVGGIYPFTIKNDEQQDKAYIFSIVGEEPWGYSQIEPQTIIIVPAGQSREGAVRVWMNEGFTGEYGFSLIVTDKESIVQEPLIARMPELEPKSYTALALKLFGVALVLLLILGAIYLVRAYRSE